MLNRYRRAWGPKPHTFIHTVKLFLTINRFYFVVSLFLCWMGVYWLFGMIWDVFCFVVLCMCFLYEIYIRNARKTNAPLTLWLRTVIWPLNSTTGVSDGFGLTGAKMTIIRFRKIEIGRNFLLSAWLAAVKMNQWLGESFISSITTRQKLSKYKNDIKALSLMTPVVGCPSIEWRYMKWYRSWIFWND